MYLNISVFLVEIFKWFLESFEFVQDKVYKLYISCYQQANFDINVIVQQQIPAYLFE